MFRLYNNNVIVKHNSFSLAVQKLTQINVFSLFDAVIYSNSYLDCYKKHNSFELNKIVILKTFGCCFERHTFDSSINHGKLVQKLSSEQFLFENIKIESNSRFLKYYIRVYQRE